MRSRRTTRVEVASDSSRRFIPILPLLLLLLLLLVPASPARALAVREARWGFDGRAMPEQFNLLSVLVENGSTVPFDGSLALWKHMLGGRRGAELRQSFTVAPEGSRWVQFEVFVAAEGESWLLSWGRGKDERMDLTTPPLGEPATVFLEDPDEPLSRAPRLRPFPANLFPATASAAGGLLAVALDRTPRWQPAQRGAFLDWLRLGGTVHVLRNSDGRYPVFRDDLSFLNVESSGLRVGAGLAVHHRAGRQTVDKEYLERAGFTSPELVRSETPLIYDLTGRFFDILRTMIKRDQNWLLIYAVGLGYLVMIGPVNYVVARKNRRGRVPILFFLAVVAVAGAIYGVLGNHGFSESNEVHSLSYARLVGGSTYEVTQWVNLFVTKGREYRLHYENPHEIFSTTSSTYRDDRVEGVITNGSGGDFRVRIPLHASQSFVHKAVMRGPDPGLGLAFLEPAEKPGKLAFDADPGFLWGVSEAWVLRDGSYRRMTLAGNRLEADLRIPGTEEEEFFSKREMLRWFQGAFPWNGFASYANEGGAGERFDLCVRPLIAWAVGSAPIFQYHLLMKGTVPPGRTDLFLFATAPEVFHVRGEHPMKEIGHVLYHVTLFEEGSAEAPEGSEVTHG